MKLLKFIVPYLLGVIVAIYIDVDLSHSFAFAGVSGVIYVVLLLAGLGLVITYLFKKNKHLFYHGCCLLCSFLLLILVGGIIIDNKKAESKKKAGPIIEALEKYKNTNSHYPEDIREIKNITEDDLNTKMGFFINRKYWYNKHSDSEYAISFSLPAWCIASYSSKTKTWVIND
jgi:hypothetical protein